MRYLSVCSGIEAATVAWHPLGWEAAAFSEIEAFPRAVLAHHYPETPLHGNFTTIGADDYGPIDLLVGGTPCQSFSIAGLRKGLADERGNLALEYLRLADRARPRWLVWENVPGVLSSNGGKDFGAFLGGLAELGYGFAYAVLDAQHFGVPQRRRRVFVVGHLGDWRRAAAVLFERHSLSGDTPPRREKGQESAARFGFSATGSVTQGYGAKLGTDESCQGSVIAIQSVNTPREKKQNGIGVRDDGAMYSLTARDQHAVAFAQNRRDEVREVPVAGALAAEPGMKQQTYIAFTAKDYATGAYEENDTADPLTTSADRSRAAPIVSHANGGVMPAVAFGLELGNQGSGGNVGWHGMEKPVRTLDTNCPPRVATQSAVRRLTPRECERLQGFPDDYTLIPYRGKPAADGPRYKALGNSMAVPVMRWIGQRIAMIEAIQTQAEAA